MENENKLNVFLINKKDYFEMKKSQIDLNENAGSYEDNIVDARSIQSEIMYAEADINECEDERLEKCASNGEEFNRLIIKETYSEFIALLNRNTRKANMEEIRPTIENISKLITANGLQDHEHFKIEYYKDYKEEELKEEELVEEEEIKEEEETKEYKYDKEEVLTNFSQLKDDYINEIIKYENEREAIHNSEGGSDFQEIEITDDLLASLIFIREVLIKVVNKDKEYSNEEISLSLKNIKGMLICFNTYCKLEGKDTVKIKYKKTTVTEIINKVAEKTNEEIIEDAELEESLNDMLFSSTKAFKEEEEIKEENIKEETKEIVKEENIKEENKEIVKEEIIKEEIIKEETKKEYREEKINKLNSINKVLSFHKYLENIYDIFASSEKSKFKYRKDISFKSGLKENDKLSRKFLESKCNFENCKLINEFINNEEVKIEYTELVGLLSFFSKIDRNKGLNFVEEILKKYKYTQEHFNLVHLFKNSELSFYEEMNINKYSTYEEDKEINEKMSVIIK